MDQVFIKKEELNYWIAKYFKKDLVSIEDMLGVIEDLDSEVASLKIKIDDMETEKIFGATEIDDYEYEKMAGK